MRMDLAVGADLAAGSHEHMRMQHGSCADARCVFDHDMRSDHAVVTDRRMCADHAVRPETNALADDGVGMHNRGRMPRTPLFETRSLRVEIFEQHGHAERDVARRKAAGVRADFGNQRAADFRMDDQNRRIAAQRGSQLCEITDIDQTARRRFFEYVTKARTTIKVPA
jgi:hypothetical protein